MSSEPLRHKLRAFLKTAMLLVLAGAMVIGAALLEPRMQDVFGERVGGVLGSADNRVLAFERIWRQAFWRFGWDLPGTPPLDDLDRRLAEGGFEKGAPIFMRIFKREFLLEIWLKKDDRFDLFASYPICRFSGRLGPKLKQGDRQAPEGIYTVSKAQLNPASRWHRSFNLGFPNTFDRAHGRTGSFLMVHGGCSSIGCYAMTNPAVDEIWELVTSALDKGQARFQVQSLPFRLTPSNLADARDSEWHGFWTQLAAAYRAFEDTRTPPDVDVCGKRYVAQKASPGSLGNRPIRKSCKNSKNLAVN